MNETKPSRIWVNLLSVNTYWVGLSFMWNSLHVILLPVILLRFTPEGLKNTYLGGIDLLRADRRHDPAAHQRGD